MIDTSTIWAMAIAHSGGNPIIGSINQVNVNYSMIIILSLLRITH